jgi:hypothetical protein
MNQLLYDEKFHIVIGDAHEEERNGVATRLLQR